MREYGVDVVQAYMTHIQNTAEMSVRELMKQVTYHYGAKLVNIIICSLFRLNILVVCSC